jgi:hypothetical protein
VDAKTIKAGVDRAVITPETGMYLIGYGDRGGGAESVHDDLTATTLVLDDGNAKLVIVALDLLFLHRETVLRIREGIRSKLRVPGRNILLCCSHTHSGPAAWAPLNITISERMREFKNRLLILPATLEYVNAKSLDATKAQASKEKQNAILESVQRFGIMARLFPKEFMRPKGISANKKYLDNLVKTLVDSAVSASKSMKESVLAHGRGMVDVGINRRERKEDGTIELGYNEDGLVDPDVEVLQIIQDEKPLATIVNHACHATILGPNSNVVSADMIGVMRKKVEEELGGLCMFIQGASGNINPNVEWTDDNMPDVRRFGEKFADAVVQAAGQMSDISPAPIKSAEDEVEAYLDIPEGMEDAPVRNICRHMIHDAFGVPKFLIDPLIHFRFPWKAELKDGPDGYTTPIHIGVLRFGDVSIGWIGMEPFVETGCAVKAASSAPITLFAGYTNGHNGYLPVAEEKRLGGYEVDQAPYALRMPGAFRADSEVKVRKRLHALLEDVGS